MAPGWSTLGLRLDVLQRRRDRFLPGIRDPTTPPAAHRPEIGTQISVPGQEGTALRRFEVECLGDVRDRTAHEPKRDLRRALERDGLDRLSSLRSGVACRGRPTPSRRSAPRPRAWTRAPWASSQVGLRDHVEQGFPVGGDRPRVNRAPGMLQAPQCSGFATGGLVATDWSLPATNRFEGSREVHPSTLESPPAPGGRPRAGHRKACLPTSTTGSSEAVPRATTGRKERRGRRSGTRSSGPQTSLRASHPLWRSRL